MNAVTSDVVTEVVTGGYEPEFPILVTTETDLSGIVNRKRKQREIRISAGVTEIVLRRLRGYETFPQISCKSDPKGTVRDARAEDV